MQFPFDQFLWISLVVMVVVQFPLIVRKADWRWIALASIVLSQVRFWVGHSEYVNGIDTVHDNQMSLRAAIVAEMFYSFIKFYLLYVYIFKNVWNTFGFVIGVGIVDAFIRGLGLFVVEGSKTEMVVDCKVGL